MAQLLCRLGARGALDGAGTEECAPAFLNVLRELRGHLVVLPPFQDRIPESHFPELEGEDAVEDRRAFGGRSGMPLARGRQDSGDDRDMQTGHLVNLTRIGGDTEAIFFPALSLAGSKRV
jgi:hypothetical protein